MAASRHGLNAPVGWGVKKRAECAAKSSCFVLANSYCSLSKIIMAWKIYDVKSEQRAGHKHAQAGYWENDGFPRYLDMFAKKLK
ncbi:hypothetical protein [Acetobacter syzygii]|uniref:hypothetical protein n=1 Tax=Acetobacter syzygii TaxID=146476 RepID=UPI0039E7BACB